MEGPELPRTIQIYGVYTKPEIYIYPVRICTKCWRLGHKSAACKSKVTCERCGKYIDESHTGCGQNTEPKCKNCKGNHLPTSKECPERRRKEHINVAMTVNKMTYQEAEELYPRTENIFTILESTDEFPQLERPSSSMQGYRMTIPKKRNINYKNIIEELSEKKKQHIEIKKNIFQRRK